MTRIIPHGAKFWTPNAHAGMSMQQAYESGLAGAYKVPGAKEELLAYNKGLTGYASIGDAAHGNGWAESGKGKLIMPFLFVLDRYAGCWPGPAQQRGDCVVKSLANVLLGSMVCEVAGGKPDEVTGKREDYPDVSPEGIKNCVIASEPLYWWRGHDGDGWNCDSACMVAQKNCGLWIRKNYEEIGIDLTRYDGDIAGKYGRTPPSGKIAEMAKNNLARAFAEASTPEERRDALANGYFIHHCGGESWSNKRDEFGHSDRTSAGWSHALSFFAYDDRPEAIKKFGGPRELHSNQWAVWNGGERDIWQSSEFVPASKKADWIAKGIVNPKTGNIMIPEGCWWADVADSKNRDCYSVSSINGWPRKNLPDWGGSLFG